MLLEYENTATYLPSSLWSIDAVFSVEYTFVPYSERTQYTSSPNTIILITGPQGFLEGDVVKIQGKFSTIDAGAFWLADQCSITIFEV